VAPLPSSKGINSALASARRAEGSPTTSSGTWRVRFGEATVLVEGDRQRDDGSSMHSTRG
jgi:hypothetical protein